MAFFCILALYTIARPKPASRAVPFANDGQLKMLYDNRMHPLAVEYNNNAYIVWRGRKGNPYIISYDLKTRKLEVKNGT